MRSCILFFMSFIAAAAAAADVTVFRITSYNVCYTKLLRIVYAALSYDIGSPRSERDVELGDDGPLRWQRVVVHPSEVLQTARAALDDLRVEAAEVRALEEIAARDRERRRA